MLKQAMDLIGKNAHQLSLHLLFTGAISGKARWLSNGQIMLNKMQQIVIVASYKCYQIE